MAIDDEGKPFTPSPDPLYQQLHSQVAAIKLGDSNQDKVHQALAPILTNQEIFGNNLIEIGLGEIIERDFLQLIREKGAVRQELHHLVTQHSYALRDH